MTSTWETGLFECTRGTDPGLNCCCQPCVWGSAIASADIPYSSFFTLSVLCGGNTPLDEAAGYFVRRKLVYKYRIDETDWWSMFVSCCCIPCARFQELNTILNFRHRVWIHWVHFPERNKSIYWVHYPVQKTSIYRMYFFHIL